MTVLLQFLRKVPHAANAIKMERWHSKQFRLFYIFFAESITNDSIHSYTAGTVTYP